ncbi:MAG: GENE II AND X PROTEINS, partial [uncultured Rubrobacteraceae bacterium]
GAERLAGRGGPRLGPRLRAGARRLGHDEPRQSHRLPRRRRGLGPDARLRHGRGAAGGGPGLPPHPKARASRAGRGVLPAPKGGGRCAPGRGLRPLRRRLGPRWLLPRPGDSRARHRPRPGLRVRRGDARGHGPPRPAKGSL